MNLRRPVLFVVSILAACLFGGSLFADIYMQTPRGSSDSPKSTTTTPPKTQKLRFAPPPGCYDYAFVSKRERGIENVYFANTCSPAVKKVSNNADNRVSFGPLATSPSKGAVASVKTDVSDPDNPKQSRAVFSDQGTVSESYDPSKAGFSKLVVSMTSGVAFLERDTARLFVPNAATGAFVPLRDAKEDDRAMPGKEPGLSPDRLKLAFIRNVKGLDRLWTCDLPLAALDSGDSGDGEGGGNTCENVRMIETAFYEPESREGNYGSPCWSQDSGKIFFSFDAHWTSTNERYRQVYMVNPDGSSLERLNAGETDDYYPACLPN